MSKWTPYIQIPPEMKLATPCFYNYWPEEAQAPTRAGQYDDEKPNRELILVKICYFSEMVIQRILGLIHKHRRFPQIICSGHEKLQSTEKFELPWKTFIKSLALWIAYGHHCCHFQLGCFQTLILVEIKHTVSGHDE